MSTPNAQPTPFTVNLATPKVIKPAVTISKLTLQRLVDLPKQRLVRAFFVELQEPLDLWRGDAYDAAGDWTQAMAEARIVEILNS